MTIDARCNHEKKKKKNLGKSLNLESAGGMTSQRMPGRRTGHFQFKLTRRNSEMNLNFVFYTYQLVMLFVHLLLRRIDGL